MPFQPVEMFCWPYFLELILPVIVGFTMFDIGVLFGDDVAIGEPGLSNEFVTLVEELIDDNVLSDLITS